MKNKNRPSPPKLSRLQQIAAYGITGGLWFWSGYAMFALLYSVIGWGIVPAKILSYIFGLSVNFVLERFWVFGDDAARKQLQNVTLRYIGLSAVNLVIDTAIVWSLSILGISPYIGQFVSAGFFTVWNYVWYKLWVFAHKSPPGPKRPAAPHLRRPKTVRYQTKKARA